MHVIHILIAFLASVINAPTTYEAPCNPDQPIMVHYTVVPCRLV